MIGRTGAMTDCQTMADRFGHVGLGRRNSIDDRTAARQMCGNGGCIGATGAVGVRRLDKFALEYVEESSVIEQVSSAFGDQMPALDEHVFAAEAMKPTK